jgi:hypothetical protein
MPNRIDTPGVYRGKVTEMSLGVTKASGYPQAILRVTAEKKFIEDQAELAHFELSEPDWQDWTDYNEEVVGYLVLFNDADNFNEQSALMNYEQLQAALGWEGVEFESLNDGSYEGKEILYRMEEDEYNGKVSIKMNWVDRPDAPPGRELRRLDSEKVSELSAKLQIKKPTKPAKAAKPAKAKDKKVSKAEDADETAAAAPKPKAKGKGKGKGKAGPPKAKKPEVEAEVEAEPEADADAETSIPTNLDSDIAAWEYVCDRKGDTADSEVEETWISACAEVLKDRDPSDASSKDWAKIVKIVVSDLALGE